MCLSLRNTARRGRSSVPRTRDRTRARRRPRATTFWFVCITVPRSPRHSRSRLPGLAPDALLRVLDALRLVRLRRPQAANGGRDLSEQLAVRAFEGDNHLPVDLRRDPGRELEGDGMRVAEGEEENALAGLGAVADAVDLQDPGEALARALDHVRHQHAREAVQAARTARILAPPDDDRPALDG